MKFENYKKWFTSVFGAEATEFILDEENECIRKNEKELRDFFEKYQIIEPIKNVEDGYIIKGYNECLSKKEF